MLTSSHKKSTYNLLSNRYRTSGQYGMVFAPTQLAVANANPFTTHHTCHGHTSDGNMTKASHLINVFLNRPRLKPQTKQPKEYSSTAALISAMGKWPKQYSDQGGSQVTYLCCTLDAPQQQQACRLNTRHARLNKERITAW